MIFPSALFDQLTNGFQYEGPNLNDCELKCYYNLMHLMFRRTKDKAFKVSMKDVKNAARHQANGFFNHNALVQDLDNRIILRGYRLIEGNKSSGVDIEILRDIVNDPVKSPALVGVGFGYFAAQGLPIKQESIQPPDHCIIVLKIDWTAQIVLIFDPMEQRICSKKSASYNRELPLSIFLKHWNSSKEPGWASWVEKKSTQTKLVLENE